MKEFLNEEIKRSLVLMGLPSSISPKLTEAFLAAAAGNPIVEFVNFLKSGLKKGEVGSLTSQEKMAIISLADEAGALDRSFDEFGDVGERLTKDQITILKNFLDNTADWQVTRVIAYGSMVFNNTQIYIRYLDAEEILFETLQRELDNLGPGADAEMQTLKDLFDAQRDFDLGALERQELANKALMIAEKLEDSNPYKSLIRDTAQNELQKSERQIANGTTLAPTADEFSQVTTKEIEELQDAAKKGEEVTEDPFEDIVFRGLEDLEDEIGEEEAMSLEEAAQKAFMEKMNQTCKTKFCGTMYAYWKGKSPKFQQMWDITVKELEKLMKTSTGESLARIPKETQDTYNIILKKFKDKNTPLTLDQYMKLGEKVYEKWKTGGFWERFSLSGLFGTGRSSFYTVARFSLGSDLYTGSWSFKSAVKKWAPFNALMLLWSIGTGIYELKVGSDDPNKTEEEILRESIVRWFKNSVATGFGLAPLPRLAMEGMIEGFKFFLPESTYVNKEDLIEYLKENSLKTQGTAWTIIEINDNIFNKKGVTVYFGPNDDPPITQIKGITDPLYSMANGRYFFEKTGEWSYQMKFIPEGQKKPKVEEEKTKELDKQSINTIEEQLATNSVLSPFIKDRLTGIIKNHKKHIDFKSQKKMSQDDGKEIIVLIFEWKDKDTDNSYKIAFNYTKFKSMNNPDLKSQENWAQLVKEYKE